MPLIEIRQLTKEYRMGETIVRALNGVDLSIDHGEFVAITGASGSGKSTMMHLIGCLDRPTSGVFLLDGQNVSRFSDGQLAEIRNRKIGFVFQTFNLINRTSAIDNVAVPLFYARRSNARPLARRALERVGLAQRGTHNPNELSGGERQRVAIARAIVSDPPLLLADEPTGNLDTRTGQQIMDIFHRLNDQGVTIIIVTHEADIAMQAKRVVQMRDGKILRDAAVEAVYGRRATKMPQLLTSENTDSLGGGAPAGIEGDVADAAPEPVHASDSIDAEPPLVRGANGALALGVAAPTIAISAWVVGTMAQARIKTGALTDPSSDRTQQVAALAAILLAFLLGLIAIVVGRRALKRIRERPEAFSGAGRARMGMVLGWFIVIAPVLAFLIRAVT